MSFEELLWESFGDKRSNNDAVVICRSNKRANMFNQAIRSRVLQEEGELSAGDKLMIVKNNYFWSGQQSAVSGQQSAASSQQSAVSGQKPAANRQITFLANGDMIEITRINKFEEMYGFHFADVDIQLMDYDDAPTLSVKIILETLHSDAPALTNDEAKRLYQAVEEDYMDIPRASDRRKAMKENPYYNALQVKYAYAVTCHKAQGGQWQRVFLDQGYMTEDMLSPDYFRWLYTAFTRATETLYLVNWPKEQME